jgi:uncharacterized protein with PQ loop repeat
VVVFSPQFIENYLRQSGEGLSLGSVIVWLIGDLANLLGAILANLLPTMIILAIYVCYFSFHSDCVFVMVDLCVFFLKVHIV